jgi:hypothetical protein
MIDMDYRNRRHLHVLCIKFSHLGSYLFVLKTVIDSRHHQFNQPDEKAIHLNKQITG